MAVVRHSRGKRSGDHARNSGEVAHRDDLREPRSGEHRAHGVRLIVAVLDGERAAGHQAFAAPATMRRIAAVPFRLA